MHTGKVIKFLRTYKNMTQDQLSDVLGVNKSSIQKYESGGCPQSENGNNTETVHIIRRSAVGFRFSRAFEK